MKTLKELIVDAHCRKGPAVGKTSRGAFWLATDPVKIRDCGGDGIGNNAADCQHWLQLRHYRSGEVSAVIHGHYWHQNGSHPDQWQRCDGLLACSTVEQVIVVLKGTTVGEYDHAYSDNCEDRLTVSLTALGLAGSEPSPDEEATSIVDVT